MEIPPPDPAALLSIWMEWERGESTPGKVLSDLKRSGMRSLLESTVLADADAENETAADEGR